MGLFEQVMEGLDEDHESSLSVLDEYRNKEKDLKRELDSKVICLKTAQAEIDNLLK
jgi:hypothetical protein